MGKGWWHLKAGFVGELRVYELHSGGSLLPSWGHTGQRWEGNTLSLQLWRFLKTWRCGGCDANTPKTEVAWPCPMSAFVFCEKNKEQGVLILNLTFGRTTRKHAHRPLVTSGFCVPMKFFMCVSLMTCHLSVTHTHTHTVMFHPGVSCDQESKCDISLRFRVLRNTSSWKSLPVVSGTATKNLLPISSLCEPHWK